jgi:hypothetical protein
MIKMVSPSQNLIELVSVAPRIPFFNILYLASNPHPKRIKGALKTDTKEAIGSPQKEIDLHFELISDTFQSFSFAGLDQATKLIDPTGLEYDVPVQHYNPNKPFPSIAWSSLESVENFMRAVAEQCCVDVGLLHNLNNNLELDQSTFKKPADVTHVKLFGPNIWHGPRIVNFCAFQPRRQNGTKRSINGNELTFPRIRLFGVHGAQNSLCPTHFNPLQSSQIQRLLIERFQTLANANINSSFVLALHTFTKLSTALTTLSKFFQLVDIVHSHRSSILALVSGLQPHLHTEISSLWAITPLFSPADRNQALNELKINGSATASPHALRLHTRLLQHRC